MPTATDHFIPCFVCGLFTTCHVKFSPCTWLVQGKDGHYKNVLNEDKHSEKIWPAWGICIWRVRTRWWWGRGRGSPSWAGRCCSRAHPQTSSQGRSCNITYLYNIYTLSKQYLDIIYTVSTDYLNRHLAPDAAASLQTMCWHYSLPHQYLWTEHKKYHKLFLYSIFST